MGCWWTLNPTGGLWNEWFLPRLGLHLTDDECKQTTGLPIPDVIRYWFVRSPWTEEAAAGRTHQDLADAITDGVHERIATLAEPMPGAIEALQFFADRGIPTAIASASPMSLIEVVVDRLGIRDLLTLWHSATLEARNKPAPDVYLGTARKLNVLPAACIAFEDSGNGLKSAYAAGMHTVAVPAGFEYGDAKFCHRQSDHTFPDRVFSNHVRCSTSERIYPLIS